jgi:hypothetical protein
MDNTAVSQLLQNFFLTETAGEIPTYFFVFQLNERKLCTKEAEKSIRQLGPKEQENTLIHGSYLAT